MKYFIKKILTIPLIFAVMSIWPAAIVHSIRCYENEGATFAALMTAPLYFIGFAMDKAMGYGCDKPVYQTRRNNDR